MSNSTGDTSRVFALTKFLNMFKELDELRQTYAVIQLNNLAALRLAGTTGEPVNAAMETLYRLFLDTPTVSQEALRAGGEHRSDNLPSRSRKYQRHPSLPAAKLESFGALLKRKRLEAGLGQKKLAKLSGTSRMTVQAAEQDSRSLKPETRAKLLKALDLTEEQVTSQVQPAALTGESIRKNRMAIGMDQLTLAKRAKLCVAHLNRIERGKSRPGAYALSQLAKVFESFNTENSKK